MKFQKFLDLSCHWAQKIHCTFFGMGHMHKSYSIMKVDVISYFFSLELWNVKVTYGFGFWGLGHRASLGSAACGVCGTAAPLLGGAPPWVRSAVLALTPNFYLVVPRSFVGGLVHDARSFDGIVLKKMRASLGLHSVLFKQTDEMFLYI